jgi:uncharacterized protein (UPF0333 family)
MSLKKYLISYSGQARIRCSGQVFVEYFVLLTVIAILTLLAGSYFFQKTQNSTNDFRATAFNKINPDAGY